MYTSSHNSFWLRTDRGSIQIDPIQVLRVEAISNYSCIHFTNGKKLVVAKLLKWFESALPDSQFVRVHRTHLLNMQLVKSNREKRTVFFELPCGNQIKVARRKKSQEALQPFM